MSGGSEIGALRVSLSAETAAFEKGMKRAGKSLDDFGISAIAIGGVIAQFATRFIDSTVDTIKKAFTSAIDQAEALNTAAGKVRMPVEEFTRLAFAAGQSGVSVDGLTKGIGALSDNMVAAAEDADSGVARALLALGVSAQTATGQMRPTLDVLFDLADKFSKLEDSPAKTALAIKIFGSAAGDILPMLDKTSAELRHMIDNADELGRTLDGRVASAAARMRAAMADAGGVITRIGEQAVTKLIPTLANMAEHFLSGADKSKAFEMAVSGLTLVLKGLITAGAIVGEVFKTTGAVMFAVAAAALQVAQGEFKQAFDTLKNVTLDTLGSVNATITEINAMWSGWTTTVETSAERIPRAAAPIIQATNSMADAMRALHRYTLDAMNAMLNAPTATFGEKMAAAEAAVRSGALSFTRFGEVVKKIKKEDADNMHDLASATSSALTTIFGKSKVAAIASAVINTAQGITKNLAAYPMPLAGIMAGITAASGAAQIAAIKSSNIGGGGGSAPSASAGGGSADAVASAPQMLQVQGFNPSDYFRGDAMRGVVEQLLQFQQDGGQVFLQP